MSVLSETELPQSGVWLANPSGSSARFSVGHHAVTTFTAGFFPVTASYDAEKRVLEGSVRLEDLTLPGLEQLKGHLMRADFFDAENHPTIVFSSSELQLDGGQVKLEGELTMRGVSRHVSATGSFGGRALVLNYRDHKTYEHMGLDLYASIDRREFDVSYNDELPGGRTNLGWNVALAVSLELMSPDEVTPD